MKKITVQDKKTKMQFVNINSQMMYTSCLYFAVKPEPPTNLAVTNIKETSVILQFAPGFTGHTSISLWIVQKQSSDEEPWETVYEESNPDATSLLVTGLHPYTEYR